MSLCAAHMRRHVLALTLVLASAWFSSCSCEHRTTPPSTAISTITSPVAPIASSAPPAPERPAIEGCMARRGKKPTMARWSHDGRRVAMARGDQFWIFDVDTRTARQIPHPEPVTHLVWSPDDARLATQSDPEYTIRGHLELWNPSTGALMNTLPAHAGMAPSFTPDGALVVFTGRADRPPYDDQPTVAVFDLHKEVSWPPIALDPPVDDRTYEWDRMGPPEPVSVLFDRSRRVAAIRWRSSTPLSLVRLEDRRFIAIGSRDKTFGGMAMTPDEQWLVWGEWAGVERWNLSTHRRASRLASLGYPIAMAMHPRRARLVVLTNDGNLCLWDVSTGRRLWTAFWGEPGVWFDEANSIAYVHGDTQILVDSFLFDARTGRILEQPTGDGESMSERARRRREAAWIYDGVRGIDPVTQEERLVDPTLRPYGELDVSADRRRVVMADSESGEVLWYDLTRRDHKHVLCRRPEP